MALRHGSLFSQLLGTIDRRIFERLVGEVKAEKGAKGFTCWDQLVAMLFCQLAQAKSLREIVGGLQCCEGKLRHLGVPAFLEGGSPLSRQQRRAIWAITHCRTPAMGGRAYACPRCAEVRFAYHSCNHKACPQCGRQATQRWVEREMGKLVNAPYFMVTFTLPSELRECFFGPHARLFYDLFFTASSAALSEKLATQKGFKAAVSGLTAVLHTWNQRLHFHPHIHFLVPGTGLDASGKPVRVKQAEFLVHLPHLQAAFRQHFRRLLREHQWQVDPQAWTKAWGVHIQPAGSGVSALKYLGRYVARTAIGDSRIRHIGEDSVTFRWKDRSDHNRNKDLTLSGEEFVLRYLRHVLPEGLRSIRYYGFCHPTAKAKRMRVQFHSGVPVAFGATAAPASRTGVHPHRCSKCGGVTRLLMSFPAPRRGRGPPAGYPPSMAIPAA